MFSLFLVIAKVAAESTPGTETILLVRGGYGPGVNLFSSGSQTHRHMHQHKAPVDRTPAEKAELAKLNNVSQTASLLNVQLQNAIKDTYGALQESEQVRVDDANLKEKLAMEERKIQQGAEAEKAKAQLEAEVKSLQAQLKAEKAKTAAEHARGQAFQAKAASLEQDIKLVSRSWNAAAKHQANLAKEAEAEMKTAEAKAKEDKAPVVAKKATASVVKAHLQKKSTKKVAVKKVALKKVVDEDEDSDSEDDSEDAQDDDDSEADAADDDSTEDN